MLLTVALLAVAVQGGPDLEPLPAWCFQLEKNGTNKILAKGSGGIARYKSARTPLSIADYVSNPPMARVPYPLGSVLPAEVRKACVATPSTTPVGSDHKLNVGSDATVTWRLDPEGKIRQITYMQEVLAANARSTFLAKREFIARKLGRPSAVTVRQKPVRCMCQWAWSMTRLVFLWYIPPMKGTTTGFTYVMLIDDPKLLEGRK